MPVLMQLPGFTGESKIEGHVGWMELKHFAWGGTRSYRGKGEAGARETRTFGAQLRNVTTARLADSQSPLIWHAMVQVSTLTPVKFTWLRTGLGRPETYFAVTLNGVRLTSVTEASDGGRPVEKLEMLYQEMEFGVTDIDDSLSGVQDIVTYKIGAHTA
jgi:type VI secretion system Hcp family effector